MHGQRQRRVGATWCFSAWVSVAGALFAYAVGGSCEWRVYALQMLLSFAKVARRLFLSGSLDVGDTLATNKLCM